MNNQDDLKLDLLLSEYRKLKPNELQIKKWKKAVVKENGARGFTSASGRAPANESLVGLKFSNKWLSLVAASAIGFILGALVYHSLKIDSSDDLFAKFKSENATPEYVLTKYE
jgi:hypothetical protein